MEAWGLALNHPLLTCIFPVALVPTCKKDHELGESTHTVAVVAKVIFEKYHSMGLHKKIGPLSTANSDGASQFRKGMGTVLSQDLPRKVRDVYKNCLLFNTVGSPWGIVIACDLDHLRKRTRERIKTALGIKVSSFTFTKADLAKYMAMSSILSDDAEAERLFNPEDAMDVCEMVKCLDVVGRLSDVPFISFPKEWQQSTGNRVVYQELRLLGHVMRLMCTLIIGHEGYASDDGKNLSVSEYLERCSRLSFLLFFLFRRNRTKFLANQNYRNWQDTMKNMFTTVSLGKANGVKRFYFFLNTNKRIENLFGILQSMIRGNMNFDCLDMRDRLGDSVLIQWIYSEHPEWDRSARRLTNTMDRKNTRS